MILFTGGVSAPNFGGGVCSKFWGGGVCSKFSGGRGGSGPNFWEGGVCSNFSGGVYSNFSGEGLLQIFGGGGVSGPNFRGVSNFRNTVNVRPVRIVLECILVIFQVKKMSHCRNNRNLIVV